MQYKVWLSRGCKNNNGMVICQRSLNNLDSLQIDRYRVFIAMDTKVNSYLIKVEKIVRN